MPAISFLVPFVEFRGGIGRGDIDLNLVKRQQEVAGAVLKKAMETGGLGRMYATYKRVISEKHETALSVAPTGKLIVAWGLQNPFDELTQEEKDAVISMTAILSLGISGDAASRKFLAAALAASIGGTDAA